LLDELTAFEGKKRGKYHEISAKIRMAIERIPIATDIAEEIAGYLTSLVKKIPCCAVNATAEDLPTLLFAGQQDTYLNIIERRQS